MELKPGGRPVQECVPSTSKSCQEFAKKLSQYLGAPLSQLRKSPEERERVLEWMDKIISDCGKWILGEDPHNMDLEALFEMMYEDYKNDPEKSEILKYPKKLRTILIKDIRDRIAERRNEVMKREVILDQYEADEYGEPQISDDDLDDVWLQCARKPMSDKIKNSLEFVYPVEVIKRFFELLVEERILIIKKGEKEASRRIAELRSGSLDDITRELQKLKKIHEDYKEYYMIYKEVEKREAEYEKELREKCARNDKTDPQCSEKVKREIECEIEQVKRRFDKERRTQVDLSERLEEAKETLTKAQERFCELAEKHACEKEHIAAQKQELENQLRVQKRRRDELRLKINTRRTNYY